MGITINGSSSAGTIDLGTNGTITDLAVGGVPDNTIDNGAMADDAIGVAELSATGTASATTFLRGDNAWAAAGGGLFASYALIEDRKSDEADAGTFTSGDWRTRDLNTEVADPDGIVSLSSDQFTLGAGSYLIKWDAPAYRVNTHISRLMDTTNTAVIGYGTSGNSAPGSGEVNTDFSPGAARVTPSGSTTYEIQHQCGTTKSGNGFGIAANFGQEVYTRVEIYKEA